MRQPSFNGPRGPHAQNQGGIQKIDAQQRAVIWRLTKYVLSDYKFSIVTVLVCIAITSVTTLASTLFTRTLIDDYIVPLTQAANPEYTALWDTLIKLGLILLLGVICSYAYNRLMINVSQGTMLRLRQRIFERMERLPISYFDQHSHGETMSVYTNDVDSLRQMISTSISQVFNSVITICVTFASMVVLSVPLTLVSILMAGVMMVTTTWLGKRSRSYFRTQQERPLPARPTESQISSCPSTVTSPTSAMCLSPSWVPPSASLILHSSLFTFHFLSEPLWPS